MPTTTISLERSAYELLRSRKKADESFSEELHRLLDSASPDLKGFLDIVSAKDGQTIANAIEAIRAQDVDQEKARARRGKQHHGHRA
jgi:predicted CopG family antitoxin